MKRIVLFGLLFFTVNAYSQDTSKINQIDSLVKVINSSSTFKIRHDTISQDHPELGLSMKTYLTTAVNGDELKKYVNKLNAVTQENGTSKQIVTSNTFYYSDNKLIKVEEFGVQDEKEQHFDWYFSEEKCIYHTWNSDKADARANLLLSISKAMQSQIKNKN